MRFRKTLIFFTVTMALVFALPAQAQRNSVAPTLRSAHADLAASLPRHGGVKPPLRTGTPWRAPTNLSADTPRADLKVSATTAAGTSPGVAASPAKPFTQDQVSNMVRDGFGDESGAKLIEQRGIDFAPSEDFYQTLKAAGASEAWFVAEYTGCYNRRR